MDENEVDAEKMRIALSAIANEMQKLHNESLNSHDSAKSENEEILNKLIKCKTSLSLKKLQIKKLRKNLRTACAVAKTMSSAKATETASLNSHLDFARNRYLDLVHQHHEKNEMINKLSTENENLREQLQYFNNVIELGYKELQKIRDERVENISTLEQLKHIIVCCGQYYADHCNEHERCARLEQRNRFLNNKILIMESNLDAAAAELRNRRVTVKPHKEYKKENGTKSQHLGVVCSEYQIGSSHSNYTNLTMTKIELNKHSMQSSLKDLDLTTHLNTVKQLLHDQDSLIKDLKTLSKAIITEEPDIE